MTCNPLIVGPMACTDKNPAQLGGNGTCECITFPCNCNGHIITGGNPGPTHLPPQPGYIPVNCLRHQAPAGYRYVDNGYGQCVLVHRATGRVVTQPGVGIIPTINTTASGVVGNVTTWIQNNKGLAAALALGVVWVVSKNTK